MYVLIALIALHTVASVSDYRFHRIPNALVGAGTVAAFVLSFMFAGGATAVVQSFLGFAVGFAVFLPLYALGKMGAGDVKLLAMSGAWLGPYGAFMAGMYSVVIGGALAILWLIHFNGKSRTFEILLASLYSLNVFTFKKKPSRETTAVDDVPQVVQTHTVESKMPYALAIGLGSILSFYIMTTGAVV